MRFRLWVLVAVLGLLVVRPGLAAPSAWSILAAGIEYQQFHLTHPRPINVFVARLDRSQSSATIDSAIAQGKLSEGRETVSRMAARYDQTINYWGETWGNRSRVVAAINGYYFNLGSGRPWAGQIQSGWYAQRFSEYIGDAGFGWTLYRSAFIGKCVFHTPRDQFLTMLRSGDTRKFAAVNMPRGADELVLYTPHFDASTRTDSSGVEVLVEMARPALVLPDPAQARGTVVKIRDFQGNTPIPFDHIVLSATGAAREGLLARIQNGDEIGVSQEISNCNGSSQPDWTKTYAAIGGDYHFLTGGAITLDPDNPDAFVPNSRSAVAYNTAFVYFIVVDGFNPGMSEGMSIRELAEFSRDTLGATDAVTLDSGGSATMVINGQVVNNTYCNFTRRCGTAANVAELDDRDRPAIRQEAIPAPPVGISETAVIEALVGNALMMVAVEPKIQFRAFIPDQTVITRLAAELRLGPGTNYDAFATVPAGSEGTTLGMRYNDLNGVYATGAHWQRVEFNHQKGWIRQEALIWEPPSWWPRFFLPMIRR